MNQKVVIQMLGEGFIRSLVDDGFSDDEEKAVNRRTMIHFAGESQTGGER